MLISHYNRHAVILADGDNLTKAAKLKIIQ